jgi:DNA invertase Pin-like site-specific DNA recombinase
MAMIAEEERRMISRRTKDALAAAKRRGVKLGGYRAGSKLTAKARKAGQEANARIAASLRAIAAGLNARGIPTARGSGSWSATQVLRTMARR